MSDKFILFIVLFLRFHAQEKWFEMSKCQSDVKLWTICVMRLKFPSLIEQKPQQMHKIWRDAMYPLMGYLSLLFHWTLFIQENIQYIWALMSTLALSESTAIGFVQKQMATVTEPLWLKAPSTQAAFNMTHLSGSLKSGPSLNQSQNFAAKTLSSLLKKKD